MSPTRTLSLVIGYVPGVDRWPTEARRHAMSWRFAFVMSSYRSDSVDAHFDVELYEEIVATLWRVVDADRLDAVDEDGGVTSIGRIEEFDLSLRQLCDPPTEPLATLTYASANNPLLIVESEPWARVGGPRPYDDSYTVAAFSKTDRSDRLESASRDIARKLGISIAEIHRGQPTPPGTVDNVKNAIRSLFR